MKDIHIINPVYPTYSWLIQAQVEIQQRPEWHGILSEVDAEKLLKQQPPNTYLLRGPINKISFTYHLFNLI